MKRAETAQVLALLSASFPSWQVTRETVEMWHVFLGDLDYSVVVTAVQDWILNNENYPTIAGIRKRCAEMSGALAPTATEAWAEVTRVAQDYGVYANSRPAWSHDLISQVVKTLGYYHICQTDNIAVTRGQFVKMYNELSSKSNAEIVARKNFELSNERVALPNSTRVELSELETTN